MTAVKQRGALLAKGWLLGVQFDALFTDGLYQKLGKNAIETAERLREGFQEKGFSFYLDTPTNQIFLVVDPGPSGRTWPEGRIQLLGAAGRGADGDPLRHQLGHPDGGRGGVDPPAVKRAV